MIQIKRNNNVFFTLEDFGEGSKLSYQLMDHHYIILKFTTATPVYFEIGDSVEIPDFGYFELTSSYFPKHNDSDGYDYEMQMDAYYMSWKNKLCKYRPQHGANETSFNLTTTVGVHMNVILGNLKALGLTYNGKEFSVDYTTYNNKAFDVQKRFLIEYGSISILDALNAICSEDALNCEWWIDGSIIYLGYCEMEGQTTFEQDVNVLSMSYSESKSTYITRLYAFGSDRNIPKGYFTGADADVTTDGVATDYLMLPNKEVDSDGFYAKDGYLENVNVVKNDKQAIEGVVMFDEEYPKVECRVSSIKTYDSTVDNEDGTKTTQTFWQVTSTDSFTNNFKESWIKSNLTLGIKFTSGALMGMEFDVRFKVIDKVNYFEIVANDTYGRTLPDGVMCPKVGDKYFLFNWDATKITDTDLIPTAQLSLFDRSKQYYQKTMISNSNFTCTMDGDKFYNDGTYDYHPLGEQVKLINDMFAQVDADGKHYRNSRIIGMEIPLDIPYDHPQYTVGEKAATSRLGKLEDKVDSIKVNGMQIGGTGSGNGGGVYVIGMNDTTPASDSNVYSARRSRMEFVSRLLDNTAKGTVTWEKVQKFLQGLHVGNSNNENGGSWTPDAEGRSHLITDYLEVRMKAIFEELVIKKTSTIGGKEIISPAGGVVAHKVEEVTVTYNNVSQKAYRCYFLAEQDGDEVDNDFAVNDQVRSESFNVRKGTYHKAGNHFYWRLAIGRDEEPVELEGKKYHYIDLSDTDCATASDVPMKGDVLSQCGNRSDPMRQSCLVFSAVDTYAPCLALYYGINSYSFDNKEYVEYGVDKSGDKPKAFFRSYGDAYIGDRPTKDNNYEGDSYVKYDSEQKKVIIKAELSVKSTLQGNTLEETFKDIQKQFDRKAETWYQAEDPSIAWETDLEKSEHKGDLWYNTTNGETSYWNGSSWQKQDIPDAVFDMIDGKSSIYVSKPSSYEECDLWILEAAYTLGGVAYTKGELVTAIRSNTTFNAADWTKKVIYTDDTEAKKAQASIKETQTNLTNLGNTVKSNRDAFDKFTEDGYLDSSEIAAIAQDSKRLEDAFAAAEKSYNEVANSDVLSGTSQLTDLKAAFGTDTTGLLGAKKELIAYIADIVTRYNAADSDGKKNINSRVATLYDNFQAAYDTFYNKLGLASAYITSTIIGKLNAVIGDVATYNYLKEALSENASTDINGGLILSSLIALRDPKTGYVQSGINGIVDNTAKGNGIATWWGGYMNDGQVVGFDDKGDVTKNAATSLIRFDGSGYLANGAIYWGVDGKVHADPTSFIISEKNLGAYLAFFEPTWKSGSDGSSIKDLVALTPQAPFKTLTVSNDLSVEGKLKIGSITLSVVNGALKIDGNVYSTGGMSAYGEGTSNGGGLNGSIVPFDKAKSLTAQNEGTEIASAWSIKKLYDMINSIDVTGQLADYLKKTEASTLYQPKGSYLTSHQTIYGLTIQKNGTSLGTYTPNSAAKTINVTVPTKLSELSNDSGYTKNTGTVTSVAISVPTGLSVSGSPITTNGTIAIALASGYSIPTTAKQTAWDGAVSAKHTHSNKSVLDGISSTKVSHWNSAYDWYALMTTDEETADGIINKWNEVVSFLANIAQTDTLSGIVDGINKSISDEVARAKKAEGVNASGISANKGSIATLQGYFTNGSAKKALQLTNARKLWGNSFNGTADINGSIIVPSGKYISIGNIKLEYDATNKALKITNTTTNEVANLYTSGGVSAYGVGTSSSSGGGLNGSVKSYSDALKLTSESLSEVASAYSIKALDSRISSLEGGSATAISVSGSGNAVTSVTKNGTTISIVKGSTFLTNHQSLDGYVNAISVSGSGNAITAVTKSGKTITFTKGATYLTSHQSLADYVKTSDSRLTDYRFPKFANNTWYKVGDDAYIGDHNIGGTFCIKSATNDNVAGIALYAKDESSCVKLLYDKTSLNIDHQLVMANSRIWVQGSGSAGGNNNRLTLVAGMPSGLVYNTSCRGTILYSNGIAFADPYNGNSNNDSGWIRHLETTANKGILEIGVGDDASNEEIHFRWYNTNTSAETIGYDITVPRATGTLALTSQIPTSLKSPNSLSWSGYNTGSYDGSSAKSFVIPSNTNQLTNGAGFITSSASISGNAATATNADKLDGIHANGLLTAISNSDKGISITVGGTTKSVSNISVNYASSAGNADRVDEYHASHLLVKRGRLGDYNIDHETTFGTRDIQPASEVTISGKKPFDGWGTLLVIGSLDGASNHQLAFTGDNRMFIRCAYGTSNNYNTKDWATVALTSDNVASATKLAAARTIWGQSFDGTANVSGALSGATTISASNTISTTLQNGALKIGNKLTPISAIDAQVIFNTGAAIRFGETAWDWNKWAGLKYTHSNKTIHLGIAENSAFNANSAQSDGTLRLAGIKTVTPDSGARIGNTGGDLYLGNYNNSAWVKVQDMCSQVNSSYWNINQLGNATFKSLTVNDVITCDSISVSKNAVIGGNLSVNGLINNKGILPTNYEVNNKGAGCYVSADALCSGITAITDSIQVNQVTVQYSNDSGNSWTNYSMNNDAKFNLYASNAGLSQVYLGYDVITGNNDAEKLAQIKKNELLVLFYISNSCYAQPYFASVDISKGIDTICTVEILNNSGAVVETYTKHMIGWNQINYISLLHDGNAGYGVGNNDRRYIRFRFKHDQKTTALRNTVINKIRIFSFTKYSFPTDRFMGHTGHIYNFDYNMNTYFPNSILAKGGVTAYQSSDVRLKTNITKLNCLNVIKSIGGTYEFDYIRDHKHSIGFIAQHVSNPLLKDIIAKDKDGYLKINYWSPKLISLAFGALTEIDNEVDRLKARVRELETEVEYLKNKAYALQ